MALAGKWKEVGDQLLTIWASAASAGSINLAWSRGMRAVPSYPCNPRTQCPRARLRVDTEGDSVSSVLGCANTVANFVYSYGLTVQLRQTPGQQHQTLLINALSRFRDAILAGGFTPELNVLGVRNVQIDVLTLTVLDELDHPLGDPGLRVSTGELRITLSGQVRAT